MAPCHCFGPFNTESCAAKSTDLCRFKSAAGAHLNSFKNMVVSQIQLLGKRVVSHPCCSKQVSFKTLIMEQSPGINAGLSATCCTCSHCFNLLFFMFKILMLVYWHSCSPFDKRVGSDRKAAFPSAWFSGLHTRHFQSQLCFRLGSEVSPLVTVQTSDKADFPG